MPRCPTPAPARTMLRAAAADTRRVENPASPAAAAAAIASRLCARSVLRASGRELAPRLRRPTAMQRGRGRENAACGVQMQQRRWKTIEQLKGRTRTGPFSWKAGILFTITGAFLVWFFDHEKERMRAKRMAEANKGIGTPRVGGPFELIDTNGNKVTHEDLKGRYSLVYFGFTHCPDICPEELDKMSTMYDLVEKSRPGSLLPLFVTCDPARDDPKTLAAYLKEFHPDFVGLTGTYEQVKAICKAYRVYFSTPEHVKPGEDYLVDHSVYFYIMDPDGDFVEVLGRQHSPEAGAQVILTHMADWKGTWRLSGSR